MAYSPLEQGGCDRTTRCGAWPSVTARRRPRSRSRWTLRHDNVIAIPKAKQPAHVRDNAKAAEFILTEEDLADIDRAFPPRRDVPLDTL